MNDEKNNENATEKVVNVQNESPEKNEQAQPEGAREEIRYEIHCHPPIKPDEEDADPMVDILNTINSELTGDQVKRSIVKNED